MVKMVDDIEEYIPEVGEYRKKGISDAVIHEIFSVCLMNKSKFIDEILGMIGIELPVWIIIDEDKTLQELGYRGSEHIEYHGLIFPDWNLEQFLNGLENLEEAE